MAGDRGESGEGVDDALTRAIIDAIIKVHKVIVEVKVVEALSKVHYSQVDGSSPLHPQSSPRSPNLLTSLQI
jgi:hypothetical protein